MPAIDRPVRCGIVLFGVAVLFLLRWAAVLGADTFLDLTQYVHTAWTVREGLRGTVRSIVQTPDGYLWIGTEYGVVRFDGVRFVPWRTAADEHLPSNNILSLLAARDGTLWIGTLDGLASWSRGGLIRYPQLTGEPVFALLEDHEGVVWVGSVGKLCAIRSGQAQCNAVEGSGAADVHFMYGNRGRGVFSLYEDADGHLWAGTESGLWRWRPGSPTRYRPEPILSQQALVQGEHATGITAIIGKDYLIEHIGDTQVHDAAVAGLQGVRLLRDVHGALWVATVRGLFHVRDGRITTFSQDNGLSGDLVTALFQDREGNIWVGTGNGIDRFREPAVSTISAKQGLSDSRAQALLAARDGSLWISTYDGVNRWKDGHMTVYRTTATSGSSPKRTMHPERVAVTEIADPGLPDDEIGPLFEDPLGRIWLASRDGAAYFENGRFVRARGVAPGSANAILGDQQGNIWISSPGQGILRVTEGTVVESIPWPWLGDDNDPRLSSIVSNPSGGFWLGFLNRGIALFKDGQIQSTFRRKDGLGADRVWNLYIDHEGDLWAATEAGLSRLKNGRVLTLTSGSGLPCDAVRWVTQDNALDTWLYTTCGLLRVGREDLRAWLSDPHHAIHPMLFDGSDGIRLHILFNGFNPLVTTAADGKLWFAHVDGVSAIDPLHLRLNTIAPPVHIEQITVDGKTYPAAAGLRLPPRVRDLAIDYTALSLEAPDKVRFRFMLEGQDPHWREVIDRRHVQYSNLAPGSYRFRLIASNNSGVWNSQGDTVDFLIAPAYWQTTWFRAVCLLALLGVLWAAYRLRIKQLRSHALVLQHLVEQATNDLALAKEAAETANRAKSAFLAGMSHELRTPLNAILGYAQLLKRSKGSDPRHGAWLEIIQHSGQHLLTLINDILDIAKIEAGKQDLNPTDIQLNDFLRAIIELIRERADAKNLALVCDLAPNLPGIVRADERRLRQVLLNLLANAVKFTEHGQVTLHVRFQPPSRLCFEIRDTGSGIPEEDLKVIFQPFEQARETRHRIGGTGLGLAISRDFVRLMGGDIAVHSEVGSGSVFSFSLDLPVISAAAPAASPLRITGYHGPSKRLLVIDDIAENRNVLRDMLLHFGFDVLEARSGEEAIELAQSLRPDLILTDVVMPGMTGLEFIAHLRAIPAVAAIPVITISADASSSDEKNAIAAGANAFITKPVNEAELLDEIGRWLPVKWTWESTETQAEVPGPVAGRLIAPPREIMQDLRRMAMEGSMRDILRMASHVADLDERYKPFAEQLRSLASRFQSKAILCFIEQHLDEERCA